MQFKCIKYQVKESIALIKLNRPDVMNSVNLQMAKEIQSALESAANERTVRAVMMTGEGRAFCAGQDLSEATPQKDKPMPDIGTFVRERYNPIVRLIRNTMKPVLCAVNGIAAGAGANIALACDIVVASDKAYFLQAFSKIGLIPDSAGTFILPRLVGFQRAISMAMLADKGSASEALEMGLIYKVFPESEFETESMKLAEKLASMPTKGLALIKKAFNKSFENNFEDQLELEAELQTEASNTYDFKEGVNAFLEKREPKFKGE